MRIKSKFSPEDKRWGIYSRLLILLVCIVGIFTVNDYGISWDENVQHEYGKDVYNYFASSFNDKEALNQTTNLYLYGGLFETFSYLVSKEFKNYFLVRHILSFFCLIGLMFYTMKITRLFSSQRTAFISILFLATFPTLYGHSFINSKDIPFALATLAANYYFLKGIQSEFNQKTCIKLGIAMGCALGIRVIGIVSAGLFIFLYALKVLIPLIKSQDRKPIKDKLIKEFKYIFMAIIIAWVLMIICWPWALQSPFIRPLHSLSEMGKFKWDGLVLMNGHYQQASTPNPLYLYYWAKVKLPEYLIILSILYPLVSLKCKKASIQKELIPLLTLFIAPILIIILKESVLYNGLRHILFILCLIPIIAALSLDRIMSLSSRSLKTILTGTISTLLAIVVYDMLRYHPYEYTYFNRIFSGGRKDAMLSYETDYWGTSHREAMSKLATISSNSNTSLKPLVSDTANGMFTHQTLHTSDSLLLNNLTYTPSKDNSQYLLALNKGKEGIDLQKWTYVNEIERFGIPYNYIYKSKNIDSCKIQFNKNLIQHDDQLTKRLLCNGWSVIEEHGVWSQDEKARIKIPLNIESMPLNLQLELGSYINKNCPQQIVDIYINHEKTKTLKFVFEKRSQTVNLTLDKTKLNSQNILLVEFVNYNLNNPSKSSQSKDTRDLGVRLKSLTLSQK